MDDQVPLLSELESDALREVINLSFGDAACTLSEVVGLYVQLNVPKVAVLSAEETTTYIREQLDPAEEFSVVEQYYIGKLRGTAFLVFSQGAGTELLRLFDVHHTTNASHTLDVLERETYLEVGNIIIGACVSKLAEFLSDQVAFMPPRFLGGHLHESDLSQAMVKAEGSVIILKTVFQFEAGEVDGNLFLVNGFESTRWLKQAIQDFINKYA
jgi:chemotaxis protein CheC